MGLVVYTNHTQSKHTALGYIKFNFSLGSMLYRPIQCLAKVFVPLHFFLFCYGAALNDFSHINLHSIHHIDNLKTELSQICKLI